MNDYVAYLKEREGLEVLSEPGLGFVTYKIQDGECYLQDIYVVPEKRKSGMGSVLANVVADRAKRAGCEWLVGSVSPSAAGSHDSLLILLAYGMTLKKAEKDMVYFAKRIV